MSHVSKLGRHEVFDEFREFCKQAGLAESTFGRLAINDGKLMSRLRDGGKLTAATLEKVRAFMLSYKSQLRKASHPLPGATKAKSTTANESKPLVATGSRGGSEVVTPIEEKSFRFFDNRQKYLLFVNTCSEKWVVAERVALELASVAPRPPAFRLFDAGMGDGTILTRVMRAMHRRFPNMPFYVVGKEISLEDVRLSLDKVADRLFEHPATVLTLTNLNYADAPWITPRSAADAQRLLWKEVALTGSSAHEFGEQLIQLQSFLAEHWTARASPKTGNPIYDRPIVLTLYRDDHRFLLDRIIPKPGRVQADFDLIIASQPYRARASTEFKAQKVLAPLAKALGPGGRLIGIHSIGDDPGLQIIQKVWPGEDPFSSDRHALLAAVKSALGSEGRGLQFNAYPDQRSIFRYAMHTLPGEVSGAIGTSTLFAAWNAAIYVAQIEDQRLSEAVKDDRYLAATDEVLKRHNGLWFNDESFVIARRR